jgi:hypothetical protein
MTAFKNTSRWMLAAPVAVIAASTLALAPAASAVEAPQRAATVPVEGEDGPTNPIADLLPLPEPEAGEGGPKATSIPTEGEDGPTNPIADLLPLPEPEAGEGGPKA